MKLLIILIASLIMAETHNFREVNHHGKTLKNVQLVLNDSQEGFSIWYKDRLLKLGAHMVVSCEAKEKFCLVDNNSHYGWIGE